MLLAVLAPLCALQAQTIGIYGVIKRVNYLQTSSATPVVSALIGDPDGFTYHFDVSVEGTNLNLFSSIKLQLPNATQYTLVDDGTGGNRRFNFGTVSPPAHGFATKPELDNAFANGTYHLIMAPSYDVPLALTPDNYPAEIPTVMGGTWDASGRLVINAATGATVNFNTFSNYADSGYIGVNLFMVSNGVRGSGVFSQGNISITGFLADPLATSFTVAPNTLLPGQTYYVELSFSRLTTADHTTIPNGALGHANFDYLTGFMIRTLGSFKDFNGDGKSDIALTNTATGERAIWLMNGTAISSGASLGVLALNWSFSGTGDFNGDGKADLVLSNTATGERAIWLMNGTSISAGASLGVLSTDWTISGTGDFNADGKSDIVLTNTVTGERAIWLMNGTSISAGASLGVLPTAWSFSGIGDFNADGKADLFLTNTATGERAVWLMNGMSISAGASLGLLPTTWSISGTDDFNGDGKSDILLTNTSTGDRAVWLMNGLSISAGAFIGTLPTNWTFSRVGDFNGDGKADIFLTNTASGERAVWLMNGTVISAGASLGIIPTDWRIAP